MVSSSYPPLTALRAFDACRLIPSRFADTNDSVLSPLAETNAELTALFEIDNATNDRLIAESGNSVGIGIDELVFGVPHFHIINAAFSYARPEGSRFNNSERGAWYCALTHSAALAEVIFHKTVEYQEINYFHDTVRYQEFLADFSASFHDLRNDGRFQACLSPTTYIASQALAESLLQQQSLGIIYPSVRKKRGTNIACFRPALVGNVRKAKILQLRWSGGTTPSVETIVPDA